MRRFSKNITFAFIAQFVSISSSLFITFIIPKYLSVAEFGYWQLFVFYSSFVGFFHFGFNDGVYLKLGGKSVDEVNNPLLKSGLLFSFFSQLIISIIIVGVCFFLKFGEERSFIFYTLAFYLIIFNLSNFFLFFFQATNRINLYAVSAIADKLLLLALLIAIFIAFWDSLSFKTVIVLFIVGRLCSLIYSINKNKKLLKSKAEFCFNDYKNTIKVGAILMLSNIASTLILGISRFIVDFSWGLESFGKFSLSLSIVGFFLLFLSQFGMVLFPSLRQRKKEDLIPVFLKIRDITSFCLFFVYLLFFPLKLILAYWLPLYSESLVYLILLLPLCIFDGKMQILFSTYFKVFRMENLLLILNIFAVLICLFLNFIALFILKSIVLVILASSFTVALRSIFANIILSKKNNISIGWDSIIDALYSIFFVCSFWFLDDYFAFTIVLFLFLLFTFYKRKVLVEFITNIRN